MDCPLPRKALARAGLRWFATSSSHSAFQAWGRAWSWFHHFPWLLHHPAVARRSNEHDDRVAHHAAGNEVPVLAVCLRAGGPAVADHDRDHRRLQPLPATRAGPRQSRRRGPPRRIGEHPAASQAKARRPSGSRFALWAFATVVLLFVALPTLIVVPVSLSATEYLQFPPRELTLHWYELFLMHRLDPRDGLEFPDCAGRHGRSHGGRNHGGACARSWPERRWDRKNALVAAPLIVPTIIYAIAILLFFAQFKMNGTFFGLVLAHSALASPYVVIIVSAALYRSDPRLELAAQSLGASRARAIWHVTLPSVRPALATGAAFAFLTSFDDATVSFFLANLSDKTLPRKMFENLQFFISPVLAVVATLIDAFHSRAHRGRTDCAAPPSGSRQESSSGSTWLTERRVQDRSRMTRPSRRGAVARGGASFDRWRPVVGGSCDQQRRTTQAFAALGNCGECHARRRHGVQ